MSSTFFYSALMLVAGIGIPVMATLNGGLGLRLGSNALATTFLFSTGLVISLVYLFKTEGLSGQLFPGNISWQYYMSGFLMAFYIFGITWVAPRFGLGNAISFVLLGQLIAMTVIDHFGLLGAPQTSIDLPRLLGVVLMIAGVFLVVKRT